MKMFVYNETSWFRCRQTTVEEEHFFLHLLPREPPSFLNLFLIHFDVSRYSDSMAANHEGGGHRPRLAGHVLNRPDLHAALLLHFPPHCILQCLSYRDTQVGVTFCIFLCVHYVFIMCVCVCVTRLHESSQTGEHANWKDLLPSQ